MKSKKVDYKKANDIVKENKLLTRRMEKKVAKDREVIAAFNYYERGYNNEAEREIEEEIRQNKKKKLLCALDGTPCSGPCRIQYTVAGEVKCGEAFRK